MSYMNEEAGLRREGAFGPFKSAGAPVNGTDEVQTLLMVGPPDGGSVLLGLTGRQGTVEIPYATLNHATPAIATAAVKAAVEARLPEGGSVTVVRSGGTGARSFACTFGGKSGRRQMPTITVVNRLTGGGAGLTVTETTPGVNGTQVGVATAGATYMDTSNSKLYVNGGTADAPNWSQVGTQA
ncbi:MAG: hypothetical protein EON58_02190 [Alphaproteobacteria bacterium]|nr:MAG: hypothetical protein EON58_02190 [Alphaproteobacteria bacterium]